MFLTVHGTAGLALAGLTGNPFIALIIGFFSHFILDSIPHGDEFVNRWSSKGDIKKRLSFIFIMEFSFAVIFITFFFKDIISLNPILLLAGVVGGILPDFMAGFTILFPSKLWNWYERLHALNHSLLKKSLPFVWGMGLQVLTLTLLTYQLRS